MRFSLRSLINYKIQIPRCISWKYFICMDGSHGTTQTTTGSLNNISVAIVSPTNFKAFLLLITNYFASVHLFSFHVPHFIWNRNAFSGAKNTVGAVFKLFKSLSLALNLESAIVCEATKESKYKQIFIFYGKTSCIQF